MKTYIWSIPTRLSHWLIAIGFAVAYILGDFEAYLNLHFAFGALVGTLIIFRIIFGIIGPKYSNFKDFPIGLKNQVAFIKTYFSGSHKYAGHNPSASVVMLLILLVGLICSISGYLRYAAENNVLTIGINEEILGESHEILANLFLILVGVHLLGILSDTVFHNKTGTIQSIFTGYKNIESENTRLNIFHKSFSWLWLIVPFIFFYMAYGLKITAKEKNNEGNKSELIKEADDD
ncbi:MAG: cytochrome b/b6 domain-containing protein [Bacteroidota bacterium]